MTCLLDQLEPAFGHGVMRHLAVVGRDDRIVLTPDDEGRQRLRQVQTIKPGDSLAHRVDYRPDRVKKCCACLSVAERGIAASPLGDVRAGLKADHAESPADSLAEAKDAL